MEHNIFYEFSTKPWSLNGLKRLTKKIDETGSIENRQFTLNLPCVGFTW